MLKKAGNQPFNLESIKDPDLRAYLQHLSSSLNKQNQELKIQSLKNRIYERYFQSDSTRLLIQSAVEDIRMPGSSLRILIIEDQSLGKKAAYNAESGEFSREYAYLDEQIIQQLENKPQLLIPDTAKIHSIKFAPDKRFPKTIAAFHFLHNAQGDGYLWLTYEVIKEFTDFEIDLLNQITGTLSQVCSWSQKSAEKKRQADIFEKTIQLIDFPLLIIDRSKDICYMNKQMKNWPQEQLAEVSGNSTIAAWMDSKKADVDCGIEAGNRHFHARGIKVIDAEEMDAAILALVDETEFARKQDYLKLVMETLSHDFKTSLVNLQGFSKLMGMVGEMNPKQAEYLRMIGSGVEDIATIVDDVFEVIRLEQAGGLRLSANQPVEIFNRAVALIQAEARQKRIEVKINSTTSEEVKIDREFILAALHILLSNAVRSSHIGGTIYLEEKAEGEEWVLSVRDEGKGISQVDIEKLEVTHFQSHEWTGLALVHRIARFHQGKLAVESELGKGSKFIIHLPL